MMVNSRLGDGGESVARLKRSSGRHAQAQGASGDRWL